MAQVVLDDLVKAYDDVIAVDRVNLTIGDGEFVSLVGPSGCGKTTTLNLIAGLIDISDGTISVDGKVINDLDPKDRDIAMVFQNYALYPNKSVYENLAFPLKMRKVPKVELDQRVRQTAEVLSITPLLKRKPRELSGGQQQRVALGRALVRNPKVFLMDEPLSNLDAKLRVQMRTELKRFHTELSATVVYVTHDQLEAMTMSDKIAVMSASRLQQFGTPDEVYNTPANMFVAGFMGSPSMNMLRGRVETTNGVTVVAGPDFKVVLTEANAELGRSAGSGEVVLGCRPGDTDVSHTEGETSFPAAVHTIEPTGDVTFLHLRTGNAMLIATVSPEFDTRIDEQVWVTFRPDRMHMFDGQSEARLA
ncbi:MAG TPA: ABC transporter ATP-binding protein [Thermomicrobiales bacterium]|nr:ABC transporter ATP-binding protein [Thermomicrobiales bacterium]